jgi:murein DD-endopeptidase MepM/ murein hydrolase activator NlpD
MIVSTLDNRAKQEAAQAKAVREANAATMWERVSQWEVDAPAKARLDPAGTVKLRTEAQELFNSTEGADLTIEDRQALMKHVYGNVIAGIASKNTEDLVKKMGDVQDVNRNLKKERAIFESSKLISDLGAATTNEEQNVSLDKLNRFLGQIATSRELDPLDKAEMQLGLTVVMNKSMTTSEDNRQKIKQSLENYQTFQQDVYKAREAHPGDIEAQEAAIAASAWVNNIPHPLADKYNPTSAQERAISRVKLNNTERDLRDDEVARTLGAAGLIDEAGYDAELFPTEADLQVFAAQLGNGNAKLGMETPRFKQVQAAQKARNDFREAQASYNVEISRLTQQKSKIAQGDAAANLAYIKTLKPSPETDNLIKRLQIVAGNNPALQSFLPLIGQYDAMDQQKKAAFDSAFAQATQQGFNASAELTSAIDMEASAIRNKLVLKQNEMVRYGYSTDGTFSPKRAKDIERRVQEREAKREAQRAMEREQGGSFGGATDSAPFNPGTQHFDALGTLHTQMSPTGELILPITKKALEKQGPGNVNSPVGMRWGRQHNGQDYGVDPKTPIVAQMDGVVTEVAYQGIPGAGHYIRIKYPDGSTHTQMHLYQRPNLAVGQKVRAGQVVGLAGNTGQEGENSNPGNTHLHWEVWYGDKRSTPQEWSKKYRQMLESKPSRPKPRMSGPGSSITAPTRGVPGVPIKGGVLLPKGDGGASMVGYLDSPDIRDSGQQKQKGGGKPSSTPRSSGTLSSTTDSAKNQEGPGGGQVFTTSSGQRFTRGKNGKIQFLPKPQGGSSGNVTSGTAPFNNSNPLRNLNNSNRASDYNINDLDNHHGFGALKKNPRVARTLNEVAKSFGVPGEWLAEVISIETENTFRTDIKERGGSGATGMIQFYPDVRGGTTKTINGKVYDLRTIGAMSMEQQLRGPVADYLREAMRSNGMKRIPTIQDLYALVWAYGPKEKAVKMRDEHGPSGREILNRLGKFSGRKYSSVSSGSNNVAVDDMYSSPRTDRLTTPVDRTHVASCVTCQQMASNNMFVPHERTTLNKGMEIFNIA